MKKQAAFVVGKSYSAYWAPSHRQCYGPEGVQYYGDPALFTVQAVEPEWTRGTLRILTRPGLVQVVVLTPEGKFVPPLQDGGDGTQQAHVDPHEAPETYQLLFDVSDALGWDGQSLPRVLWKLAKYTFRRWLRTWKFRSRK